jgi:HD-like signal output (HDOD) protein
MSNLSISAILDADAVADMLKTISIPPLPTVLSQLLEETRRPEVDFAKVTQLIGQDPALTASLLKSANSPFFGLRSKVHDIPQAARILGLRNIANLLNGLALQSTLHIEGVDMSHFWEHSQLHAMVSSLLARHVPGINRDDAYSFGLFHDCGVPILMRRFLDYVDTLAQADRENREICQLENERHGTNHAIVGGLLARNWQLSPFLSNAIREHHAVDILAEQASSTAAEVRSMTAISLLAHHIIAGFLGQPEEPEWLSHGQDALRLLGLDEDEVEEIRYEIVEILHAVRADSLQ